MAKIPLPDTVSGGRACTKNLLKGNRQTQLMKLWRKIVSVLAGTMIAAGSVLAVASIMEPAPLSGSQAPGGAAFDLAAGRTATQGDVQGVLAWLDGVNALGAPTSDERTSAALAFGTLAELSGATPPSDQDFSASNLPADRALSADLAAQAAWVREGALTVLTAPNSTPSASGPNDPAVSAGAVVFAFDGVASRNTVAVADLEFRLSASSRSLVWTPRSQTDAFTALEPTDRVALKAAASDIPAPAYNWTASAQAELAARFDGGLLERDTLNLSMASQAFRNIRPSSADALNAELRFRQGADGSIGGVRETSEAARALAQGPSVDRQAAVRSLNWLDGQGPLPGPLAVHRMRAHAFDGALLPPSGAGGAPVPEASGASAFGLRTSDKGSLAAWFLVGGIGLSLSLVTVDALKGSRQRLYDSVRANPGLHVNELRRRLHMSPSSIEYHLSVLVGAGLIVAEDDGRYKRYYANGAGLGLNPSSPHSRNTLGALRRPHAVVLVRSLLAQPTGATSSALSRLLAIHESAAARRLDHLEEAGVLVSQRHGRSRIFQVRDPAAALRALSAVEEAPPLVATETMAPASPPESTPATQVGAAASSP